ncbi:hypothetical protein [Burkholderia thailandensis]|uniref:hypothetical protein n=1 Tax=Burkholderia thailandensis TaxID=57975 RepID=UPI0012B4E639|nr:hypothetical protein [Burkholderia thailandensis]ALJ98740.1 hypothetical protein PE067_061 [Burkholderia phage PE067]NOK53454.1 hypothetical protein [Burkholderia thailandensis]
MKRYLIAVAVLALAGCDPLANNVTGNVKVNAIVADNGVPCVLAVGGGQGGLAISCDWSASHAASVAVPR